MAAAMWTEIIENYVRGEQKEGVTSITAEITNGRQTVENFVESMGTYLMSTETTIRARGVELMSEVLTSLPRAFLNEQQIKTLLEFLCARLLDHHSITQHTLKGLLAMSFQSSFPPSSSVQVMTAIFKEVQVQTMLQVDRRTVYNIITNVLRTSLTELQGMGSEFVLGFLHAMDGEKDPRNLILVFNILPTVVNNFKIDMFIEEAYEVVACYYPVDFHPPPNDPYGISREKLALSLKACLSCTPKFAQFCMPMVMEKLSSDLQAARLDSYQLLQACAPVYSRSDLMTYIEPIWSYCRKELMVGVSVELDLEAVKTLGAVVTAVSTGVQSTSGGGDGDLNSFLRNILTECRQHLCEPDHRMIHPCSKLLVAIAAASYPACSAVLKYAIPLLLDQFNIFDQTRERMVLLDIIQRLLQASHDHIKESDEWKAIFHPHTHTVVPGVLSTLSKDQGVPELKKSGLGTLGELVQVPLLMNQTRLDLVGQELTRVLLGEANEDVRSECITTVSCLARRHTEFVKSEILNALWTAVKTGGPGYQRIVVDMATIVTNTSDDLSRSLASDLMFELAKTELNSEQHLVYLATLHTLTAHLSSTTSNLESLMSSVIYPLLQMVVSAALQSSIEAGNSPHRCGEVLVAMARIIRTVVPKLDTNMGIRLCQCLVDVFLHGKLTCLELTNTNASTPFLPLNPHAPAHQTQLVTVLQPIVCSLRRDTHIPSSKQLMSSLLHIAANSPVWLASTWAAKALAGVVNKHPTGSDLDEVLVEAVSLLGEVLSGGGQKGTVKQQALMAWGLLTKALVMRSHPKATMFLTTLLRLLEDGELGAQVPQSLGMVLEDMEDVLNEGLHADIKIMYKQRVFLQALPTIMALFDKENLRPRAVSALCYLLPSIPRPVLLAELPPIIPRLVQSLRVMDPRHALPILDILESLLGETLPSLVDQLDTLLPTLLELSTYQPSMKVRIASVRCISAITAFPHHLVYPHQKIVVKSLAARLDDKKRLVRQEAVKARTKWILLQQDTKR